MKKEYESLFVNIVKFEAQDVVTVSVCTCHQEDPEAGLTDWICGDCHSRVTVTEHKCPF